MKDCAFEASERGKFVEAFWNIQNSKRSDDESRLSVVFAAMNQVDE